MGTLVNFTLSKRREILEKSSVSESLQESLLRSPLSDKVFGLSLQKVQDTSQYPEHVKHYGASSPIRPTRTEKGKAHQLVWPQEVVKKTYHKLGPVLSVPPHGHSSQFHSF
jgi:hypothetical protein